VSSKVCFPIRCRSGLPRWSTSAARRQGECTVIRCRIRFKRRSHRGPSRSWRHRSLRVRSSAVVVHPRRPDGHMRNVGRKLISLLGGYHERTVGHVQPHHQYAEDCRALGCSPAAPRPTASPIIARWRPFRSWLASSPPTPPRPSGPFSGALSRPRGRGLRSGKVEAANVEFKSATPADLPDF
jgi:hypothetical protein